MAQELLKYLLDHQDTMIQALVALIAALIVPLIAFIKRRRRGLQTERRRKRAEKQRRNSAERLLKQYVHNVVRNPHISRIHMTGMTHPLELEKVYVQQHIHPESTLKYELDPTLREAEETQDPNLLLQAAQESLEHRFDGAIDADEAIRTHHQCVIVGDPGVGKTTLLCHLAIKSAKNELAELPSIPIYVQLNTFKPAIHKDLFGLLLAEIDDHNHTSNSDALRDLLCEKMRDGEILLLLDGLDETKLGTSDEDAENSYISMIDAIKKLAGLYPQLPIVVTVRKAGYQQYPKLQGFDELEVVDFRPEDTRSFVTKWFSRTTNKEEKIKGLTACLERSLRMQSLASNPLLLSLIAIVYEGHLELPERRADFYKQCVEVLQTKWDVSRDIKRRHEFPLIFQTQLLQEVAWHFHNQGRRYFPVEELLSVIGTFLPTVDITEGQKTKVLEQIATENGLLQEQAHGYYGFSHLTFQEYFVTLYIIANNRQEELFKHLNNPWWEEVLLLYVGSINDASSLLSTLLGYDEKMPLQDDLFHSHLILAGRCLAEKPRVLTLSLREDVINKLYEILLTTPYALTREHMANTLATIGGQRVNSRLLHLLSANDNARLSIRESVVCALGSFGERALAHELADILSHKQTDRYIRIIVTRALGVLGERSVVTTLLHLLTDDQEDIYVQQSIALTLGMLGNHNIVAYLVQQLDYKNGNALVQQSIVVTLGMLGDQSVVPKMQQLLADDCFDWHVRGSTAKVLGMLRAQQAIPTMLELLADNDDDAYVRWRIAIALGTLGQASELQEQLLSLLLKDTLDPKVRCGIAKTLGTIGELSVISRLLPLLSDEHTDCGVRMSIAIALGYLGSRDRRVMLALRTLCDNQQIDQNLGASATAALGMLGTRIVVHKLLQLIADPHISQDILLHIVHALGSLADHNSVDKHELAHTLVEILSSEQIDRYRGQNIVRLLCALGERTIAPSLLNLLSNPTIDRCVRQSIAESLPEFAHDEQSIIQLTSLLATTDIVDDVFRALWAVSRQVKGKNL